MGKAGLQFWKPAATSSLSADPRSPIPGAAAGVGQPGVPAVARGDFRQGLSSLEGLGLI